MSNHYHYVVWLDHREAHVIPFNADDADKSILHATDRHQHLHHKDGVVGAGNAPEDVKYFAAIAQSIATAGEILLVGPASAKLQFFKYLQKHAPATAERVVAVETVDHPTDRELVEYARRQFVADDRMRPQT